MTTLAESFARFEQLILGDPEEADTEMRELVKDAYFAGAADMNMLLNTVDDPGELYIELGKYARKAGNMEPR